MELLLASNDISNESKEKRITNAIFITFTSIVLLTPFLVQVTGSRLFKILEDFAYFVMILYSILLVFRNKRERWSFSYALPVLAGIIGVFLIIGLFYSGFLMEVFQLRELKYLLLIGILVPFASKGILEPVWKTLKVVATINVPFAFYQWFVMKNVGDDVTGIMGYGNSGTLSLFLLIIFFSEFTLRLHKKENIFGLYILYLFPTTINETKITFVLIPVMFVLALIITQNLKSYVVVGTIVLGLILGYFWSAFYEYNYGMTVSEVFSGDYLNEYFYATDWEDDAGRLAKVAYAYDIIKNENILFGYGLGSAYFGESLGIKGNILKKYYNANPKMFRGTRVQLMTSLLDMGIIGSIIICLFLLGVFINIIRIKGFSFEKSMAIYSFLIVFVGLIYEEIFYSTQLMYVFVFFVIATFALHDIKMKSGKECLKADESILHN